MSNPTTTRPGIPLRVEHLSKHFGRGRRRVTALDDVSLEFAAGSFTAVLGARAGRRKLPVIRTALGLPAAAGLVAAFAAGPADASASPGTVQTAADVRAAGGRR